MVWHKIIAIAIVVLCWGCRDESNLKTNASNPKDLENILANNGDKSTPGAAGLASGQNGAGAPAAAGLQPPDQIQGQFSETAIIMSWLPVRRAAGYRVYQSNNPVLPKDKWLAETPEIIRDTFFTFQRPCLKGGRVYLAVCSVDSSAGGRGESRFSPIICNDYFREYKRMVNPVILMTSFIFQQTLKPLTGLRDNPRKKFLKFMQGPGPALAQAVSKITSDGSLAEAAALASLTVVLLEQAGLTAYQAQGWLIKDPHSFAVIKLDGVEYILDFSADRFFPGAAPVFMPREKAFLTASGTFSSEPKKGTQFYRISAIEGAEQAGASLKESGNNFQQILQELLPQARAVIE